MLLGSEARRNGILVVTKELKTFLQEDLKPCLCLFMRSGQTHAALTPGIREMLFHPGLCFRAECFELRQLGLDIGLGKFFAIELIITPGSALGFPFLIKQDAHALSLRLIKMRHEGFLFALQVTAPPFLGREEVWCFIPQQIDAFLITPLLQAPADQIIDHLGYMDGVELARQLIKQVAAMRLAGWNINDFSLVARS